MQQMVDGWATPETDGHEELMDNLPATIGLDRVEEDAERVTILIADTAREASAAVLSPQAVSPLSIHSL